MNSKSNLLSAIGMIVFTAACFGQRPSGEKSLIHFTDCIIKVDSILSASSHCNRQKTSNIPPRNLKYDKEIIRIKLNSGRGDWNGEFIFPIIPEMDRPKKI